MMEVASWFEELGPATGKSSISSTGFLGETAGVPRLFRPSWCGQNRFHRAAAGRRKKLSSKAPADTLKARGLSSLAASLPTFSSTARDWEAAIGWRSLRHFYQPGAKFAPRAAVSSWKKKIYSKFVEAMTGKKPSVSSSGAPLDRENEDGAPLVSKEQYDRCQLLPRASAKEREAKVAIGGGRPQRIR